MSIETRIYREDTSRGSLFHLMRVERDASGAIEYSSLEGVDITSLDQLRSALDQPVLTDADLPPDECDFGSAIERWDAHIRQRAAKC
jgi:hypothetical protein